MTQSNNPPHSVIELTEEEHEFLLKNCEANIVVGLNALTMVQRGELSVKAAREAMDLLEQFKGIRNKLKRAAR